MSVLEFHLKTVPNDEFQSFINKPMWVCYKCRQSKFHVRNFSKQTQPYETRIHAKCKLVSIYLELGFDNDDVHDAISTHCLIKIQITSLRIVEL